MFVVRLMAAGAAMVAAQGCAMPALEQADSMKPACEELSSYEACHSARPWAAEWRKRWISWLEVPCPASASESCTVADWATMGFVQGAQGVTLPQGVDTLKIPIENRNASHYMLIGHRPQPNPNPGTVQTLSDYVSEFEFHLDPINPVATKVAVAFEVASAQEVRGLPEMGDDYDARVVDDLQLYCIDLDTFDQATDHDSAATVNDCSAPIEWAFRFELAGGLTVPLADSLNVFAGHWAQDESGAYALSAVEDDVKQCYSDAEIAVMKAGGTEINRSLSVEASHWDDRRYQLGLGEMPFDNGNIIASPAVAFADTQVLESERSTLLFEFAGTQLDRLRAIRGASSGSLHCFINAGDRSQTEGGNGMNTYTRSNPQQEWKLDQTIIVNAVQEHSMIFLAGDSIVIAER